MSVNVEANRIPDTWHLLPLIDRMGPFTVQSSCEIKLGERSVGEAPCGI